MPGGVADSGLSRMVEAYATMLQRACYMDVGPIMGGLQGADSVQREKGGAPVYDSGPIDMG